MPPLRPFQWLTHSPVALLPWLAAVFIQRPAPEALQGVSALPQFMLLLERHWYWLAFALGLGIWVGWYTATDRAPYREPEEAETAEEAP